MVAEPGIASNTSSSFAHYAGPILQPRGGDDTLNLIALLGMLKRQAWVIAVTTITLVVTTAIAVSVLEKQYTAAALIQIDTATQQLTDAQAVANPITTSTGFVAGQTDIILSDAVLRQTVQNLELATHAHFQRQASLTDRLRHAVLGQPFAQASTVDGESRTIEALRDDLEVSRIGLTYNIRVRYTANDPDFAAMVTNTVVESYIALQVAKKAESAQSASQALHRRVDDISENLIRLEQEIATFLAQGVGSPTQELSGGDIDRITGTILALAQERQQLERNLTQTGLAVARGDAEAAVALISLSATDPSAPLALGDLSTQLQQLLADRSNTAVPADETNAVIGELIGSASSLLSAALADSQAREAAARSELLAAMGGAGIAGVDLFRLQTEAQSARQMYRVALDLLNRAQIGGDIQVPDARIVSQATPPIEPSFPSTNLMLGLAGTLGLVMGTALGYFRELYLSGFVSERQVEQALGLALVATLPNVRTPDNAPHNEVLDRPLSPFSEGLRRWRLTLDTVGQHAHDGRQANTVLVTSAIPGEGKSTLALSLARLYAHAGKPVIVVDCDLRRPKLAQTAQLTEQRIGLGLLDFIQRPPGAQDVQRLILKDQRSSAHLILGRQNHGTPTDNLLASGSFTLLMDYLRRHYAVIILDGPPLLPVVDSRILMRQADSVTQVVRWSFTKPLDAMAAARDLQFPGAPPAFALLNMSKRSSSGYVARPYGTGYGTGYGDQER